MKARIPRRLPKPAAPSSQEREYQRRILMYVNTYSRLLAEELERVIPSLREISSEEQPEVRQERNDENIESKIRRALEAVGAKIEQAVPDSTLRKWALAMVGGVNRHGKNQTKKTMRSAFRGEDDQPDFEPLMHDKGLNPYFENVVDENVGLIKSIPKQRLESFKNHLVSLITRDATQREISAAISKKFGMDRDHAKLIARDQVGKLNGALNKYRQQQLGGKRYVWRTAHDSRVRQDHVKLDGRTFYWTRPPVIDRRTGRRGNPGEDFQCRCYAEMVMEDVLA